MEFKLPEVIDIKTEVDGRRICGAYSVILGHLIVYYKGDGQTGPPPGADRHEVAVRMLQEIVRRRDAKRATVSPMLPPEVRLAAKRYADSFEDEQAVRELVLSFGQPVVGSKAHARVSHLLVNSLTLVVPFWTELCDDDAPVAAHRELAGWLADRARPVDWAATRRIAVARRDGLVIRDCDICRARPIAEAVACTAGFLQDGVIDAAVEAISLLDIAADEGCWPRAETRSFQRWLVETALPPAYRGELLS